MKSNVVILNLKNKKKKIKIKAFKMLISLFCNAFISLIAYIIARKLIPNFKEMFIKANIYGIDLNKDNGIKV